jgi:hypothetical protein
MLSIWRMSWAKSSWRLVWPWGGGVVVLGGDRFQAHAAVDGLGGTVIVFYLPSGFREDAHIRA